MPVSSSIDNARMNIPAMESFSDELAAMDYSSFLLLFSLLPTILVLCISTFLLCARKGGSRQAASSSSLPGPRGLPVIGHLHLLGKLPYRSLYTLSKAHGPLMSLQLGAVPVLVASTPYMAKQILHTHDLTFTGRPVNAVLDHFTQGGSDIIFSQPNRHWRLKRQLCATHLFSSKRLQAFKWVREAEMDALVRSFLDVRSARVSGVDATQRNNGPFAVRPKLFNATNNIISRMMIGMPLSEEGKAQSLISMVSEATALVSEQNIGDYVPCLAWMDLQGCGKRIKTVAEKTHSALQAIIDERRAHPKTDSEEDDDLLQVMLSRSSSSHTEMSDKHIRGVLTNMFAAGTETTAYTVEWALAELLCNPEKMQRAQAEIDGVVGTARRVREDDIEKLPYVQAVVKETMRLYPVAPLLVPHVATKACEIDGFNIAEGTQALVNVWAIGRDSEWWEKPMEFMPERFLQGDTSSVDVRGLHFQLLPFGSGRRGCVGWGLGLVSVQIMLASLLQGFEWRSGSKPDMSEKFLTTMMMASPLTAFTTPRLSVNLYDV